MVDAPIVASTVGTRVSFALTLQDMATLWLCECELSALAAAAQVCKAYALCDGWEQTLVRWPPPTPVGGWSVWEPPAEPPRDIERLRQQADVR